MLDIKRIPIPALIGIVLTTLFVLAAIFAPLIAPHGNGEIVGDVWEPMSAAHWLGTDNLGRDLLSRMIYGARITLFIAVLATALSFSLGAILGFSAAVFGGWFDTLLSRLVDLLMSIPTLIMALVVLSVLPTNLVTKVETRPGSAAPASLATQTDYSNYADRAEVLTDIKTPGRIVRRQGTRTVLDVNVMVWETNNPYLVFPVPANVKGAAANR